MIKRTLYFGSPAYLSKKNEQLIIKKPESKEDKSDEENNNVDADEVSKIESVPIEDIGIMIVDHGQVTLTHGLIAALLENNSALVTCNNKHLPTGLFLSLDGGHTQAERFQEQIESSVPLKKQLWQQTISAKIRNQAVLLKRKSVPITNMLNWAKKVRSGDPDNYEARAAAYYWKNLFPGILEFTRDRYGEPPNQLLNYGYAILRAIVARGLVASGLLPTLGIHHHNKYNAYCLADDVMEPYRPFVDDIVYKIVRVGEDFYELSTSIKKQLLEIATVDILIENKKSPLMVGLQRTTSTLAKCFACERRKIIYPEFPNSSPTPSLSKRRGY
ncbi:MAG: type II CRISPR-associated endonuclease Cas1 [Ignavibacteria bacterium]|jgi:CRISPR-associated protein Cas1